MTTRAALAKIAAAVALILIGACGDRSERDVPVAPGADMLSNDTGVEIRPVLDGVDGFLAKIVTTDGQEVAVTNGFVRPAMEGAMSSAGYLDIVSSEDDAIVAASSDRFGSVELHEVLNDDGIMRMRPTEAIALRAGQTVRLAPGTLHLMMMRPDGAVSEGETVTVTLELEEAGEIDVPLPVERR